MISYISNKDFCYLTNEVREHLKADYKNYSVNFHQIKMFYLQDISEYWFTLHLNEIKSCYPDEDLIIYMNDELGRNLNLIQEPVSITLF